MKNFVILLFFSCFINQDGFAKTPLNAPNMNEKSNREIATFGSGCFWCVEAIFQQLKGVDKVESGYMGGNIDNPTYEQICTGNTNHAEVVQVTFDSGIISYAELLEVFWKTHDPTTLNQQGADKGTQYRSAIFYHNDEQKKEATSYKQELKDAAIWQNPITTEITAASTFYKAENYHQDYYLINQEENSYCSFVITPKIEKFQKIFKDKLK